MPHCYKCSSKDWKQRRSKSQIVCCLEEKKILNWVKIIPFLRSYLICSILHIFICVYICNRRVSSISFRIIKSEIDQIGGNEDRFCHINLSIIFSCPMQKNTHVDLLQFNGLYKCICCVYVCPIQFCIVLGIYPIVGPLIFLFY